MKLAFCTTCKGRLSHLAQTLPANLAYNREALHVLVDYGSRDGLAEWVRREMAGPIAAGHLVYYRFTEPGPFRMAHAKNLAHRLGMREGADVLVNLDADNYAGDGFDQHVLGQMADTGVFLWSRMLKGVLPRGISGRIAVTGRQFWLAGGYDEKYASWSRDDKDFHERLVKLGFHGREIDPGYLQAINHNDKVRFREYAHAADVATHEETESAGLFTSRVANASRIGCGTVYRNFDPEPISILPLPARVFGVGMHKTGTTTLATALRTLGIDCAHWPSAHWAKGVWEEMANLGASPLLERSLAATDLPLPLLFRELDTAYPGSKFVLTVRDEDQWVKSVERHFSADNPFRAGWDADPFTNRVHTLLYGRRKFDAEVFRARYRQHNTEVREYFRRRPADLLELDLSGQDWYPLCGFLSARVPDAAFPWENRTEATP